MKIHIAESKYWRTLPATFLPEYKAEIKKAYQEVTKLLPFGSRRINFFVQPRTYGLIEATGDSARTHNSEFIELAFDPTRKGKDLDVIMSGVQLGVFHEMNHAARWHKLIDHKTFLDNCVMEGLATAFARDYADEKALWGDYPAEVTNWLQEIIDKNDMFSWSNYSFTHPDGRKWIAYKVGTYIIDQAKHNSGKSVIELTQLECAEILKLAKINVKNYHSLA